MITLENLWGAFHAIAGGEGDRSGEVLRTPIWVIAVAIAPAFRASRLPIAPALRTE